MQYNRILLLFLAFGLSLFLLGCTKEDPEEKEDIKTTAEDKENKPEQAEVVSNDYIKYMTEDPNEMVQLEPGPFSGDKYNLEEVKKAIDEFPKGETKEDYYYRMVSLIAEDYRFFYDAMQDVDTSYADPTDQPDNDIGDLPGSPKQLTMNVQILFDASGSMKAEINGTSKMKLAKDTVQSFVEELPEEANISLRIYGHKGTGSDADKELSCSSSEEVYPLGKYDQEKFTEVLNGFSPAGWTPLASSIESAMNDLKEQHGENVENIVYVVSDGIETCDGDPIKAAKDLNESEMQAIVNIIGFDVDDAGQKALKKVAEAGKGEYTTVRTKQDMEKYFKQERERLRNEWAEWSNDYVSKTLESQNERVDALFDIEKKAQDLTKVEDKRMEEMVSYWNEKLTEEEQQLKILSFDVGSRQRELRTYLFKTAVAFRDELRKGGLEVRDEVRDKAQEERDKLKNDE